MLLRTLECSELFGYQTDKTEPSSCKYLYVIQWSLWFKATVFDNFPSILRLANRWLFLYFNIKIPAFEGWQFSLHFKTSQLVTILIFQHKDSCIWRKHCTCTSLCRQHTPQGSQLCRHVYRKAVLTAVGEVQHVHLSSIILWYGSTWVQIIYAVSHLTFYCFFSVSHVTFCKYFTSSRRFL